MIEVYIIIKCKEEDYHGCYYEVVEVYGSRENAEKKLIELSEKTYDYNVQYYIDTYNVL